MAGIAEQLANEILANSSEAANQPKSLGNEPVRKQSGRAEMIADEILANSGSMLGGAKDAAVSAGLSIPQIFKSLADIGRMAVGDQPVINEFTGQIEQSPLKTVSEGIENATDWAKEKLLSDAALAQERRFARYMGDPNQTIADLPQAIAENPRAIVGMGMESLAPMLLPAGAAVGAARTAQGLKTLAEAGAKLGPLGRALANASPSKIVVGTTTGANSLMNAADTFDATSDQPLPNRYEGAALSGLLSTAASLITGGAGERILADTILGNASNLVKNRATNVLKNALLGAGKEFGQEFVEEGGNAAGEQLARREFNGNELLKRAGTGGVVGGLMGGTVGGIHGLQTTPQSIPDAQQAAANAAAQISQMAQRERAPVEPAPAPAPAPAPQQPVQSQQETQPVQAPATETQPAAAETNQKVILQNRNRSSDASVQQMNAIAAKPNYLRVSGSRDFGNGAPVVAYGSVPQQQLGKQEMSVTADDERIPVQYAVVEAGDVLTSNQVNGSTNPEYETAPASRIRAIAGNGRIAGLTEAYRRGTASQYRAELREDASNLGIDPAVIDGMKAPILVRVMPSERVRADIGDISNTSGNLSMNAVETAANDVNRINFDKIVFNDNGEADVDTIIGFVRQMPIAEQGSLIDTNGQPTRAAHERFANALFKKAYGDDELVRLSAQAVDPEIRNVIAALSRVAPKMARLEGLGDLDIRGLVKQAAQVVVNAHRQGVSLTKFAAQGDITMDPDVRVIVECFAQNARSVKEMARVLEIAADFAYSEGTKDDVDMFGTVERATRQDVLNRIQEETNGRQQQSAGTAANRTQTAEVGNQPARAPDLAEPAGAEPAAQNVQRETGRTAADGRGSADSERAQENAEVVVNSSEVSAAKENRKEFRDEIKRRINEMYPEGTVIEVRVESDGAAVFVSKTTAKHTLGQRASWRSMLAALKLPQLMRTARRVSGFEENPHADRREAVSGGYRYESNIIIDGERFPVQIRVRQHPDGLRMYHARVDDKKPSGYSGVGSDSSQRATPPALGSKGIVSESGPDFQLTGQTESEAEAEAARLQETAYKWKPSAPRANHQTDDASRTRPKRSEAVSSTAIVDEAQTKVSRTGARSESIRQSMSEDKQLGDAFSRLEKSGVVEIAETTEDLPERIQDGIKGSRAANLDKERRYQNALTKLAEALRNRTSAHRVVYNDALEGWVDIDWGKLGDIIDSITYQTKGAMGLSHVIDKRSIQVPLSPNDVAAVLKKMVRTLANGELRRTKKGGLSIESDGFRVSISRKPGGNAYVVTAVGSYKTEAVPSGQLGTATPNPATLRARNDLSPGTRNRNVSVLADIILQNELLFKHSEAGDVQAVYDPETGKSYLIASNIKPGDEKGVLVHEVGVHMAADRGGRETMRPLIMRAKQIVYYGNSNGDATAKRVYQRMKDANLINSRGFIKEGFDEEAFAYLAEEMVNSKEKASSQICEWFEKLLSAVRVWLYKRGLFVSAESLSDRDLVSIAVANVRTMAQQEIGSNNQNDGQPVAFSTRKDSQDENAKPVDAVVQQRLNEGNGVWGWIRKDDGLGGHKFGAGEWVYNHAANITRMLFNYIDEKSGHTFNLNMASKEFRQAFRKYRAEVDNARTDIATAAQAMQGMSEEERRLVSDVIEKMVAPGVNPSEHVLQVAASIQNLMDAQTDELVRLGLLSAESAERWRGQYLPRVYLKQTELFEEAKKNFRKIFGSGEGIRGGHLKGRGLFRTVVGNQAIAQHKALGWEIRDPSWSDAQGELQFTGEGAEPRTPTVVMWRDFTPEERRQMGECRDAMVRMVMGYMQTQEDIALARFFDSLSRDTRFAASVPSEGWVRVPDSSIGDGSPVKRFGALAGMYVAPDVWAEIQHLKGDRSSMGRLARTLMAAWKEGKTALNPVAHVNNIVGNISLAYFAGAKALDPRTYMNAFRDIRTGAPMFKEAQRAGLLSGNFSRSEIMEMIPLDEVRKNLTGMKPGYEKVIDTFMNVGSLGLRQKLRNAYELEDTVFKYIIYKWAREKGMSIEDAVDYSGQYIFNYDDLPSGARRIRDSILPFFSWTYKAVPMLLHTAMVYPHRYFAPAMMAFAVNQAAYLAIAASSAASGDDWEDILKEALKLEDAEREALPEYAQGASIFRTPKFLRLWNNSDGTANFLDMSRLMPGGDLMDMNNQMGGIPWLQPLMPNSPQLGLFLSIFANKDAFTGREIVDRTDSFNEAFRKRLGYVYRNIAPSLAPGSYHFSRLGDAVAAASGTNLTVEPIFDFTGTDWNGRQMEMNRALAHTFGFKVRAFDWQQEVDRKARKMNSEIRDKMGQVRYKARSRYLGAVSDEAFRDFAERTAADIKERVDKREKFLEKVRPLLSKD